MAYNPVIYNPYLPSYGQMPQQQPVQPVQSFNAPAVKGTIEWVDGEVGARAVQIPMGMTMPVALWDTNEPVIYVRSINQMGMPNPIKKIRYTVEDDTQQSETAKLTSGDSKPDMSEYVRKDELASMKEDLLKSIQEIGAAGPMSRRARGDD